MAGWAVRDSPAPAPVLRALGCATPRASVPQREAAEALVALLRDPEAARKARALARRSRIDARGSVLGTPSDPCALGRILLDPAAPAPGTGARMDEYARLAPPLVREACERALARDGAMGSGDVTHVIVASCTGFMAPGLDVILAKDLDLRPDVARTLVGFQGCHAALASLRVAESIARAHPSALVLVACVELCTLHLQREGTDDNLLAATLFGDGAAAALVGGGALPRPAGPSLRIDGCATRLVPETLGGMAWRVGDAGFEMALSSYVPDLLAADLRASLPDMLGPWGSRMSGLRWAVHPGGASILDAFERALELAPDALAASRAILARHGNMSSPTVLFVLDEMMRAEPRPEPVVALAFGPGLTIEACRLAPESP